jgi:tetratricopeptide (TPR) repeat protein
LKSSSGGERLAELLRRAVIALGAALLFVLPRFTSRATFLDGGGAGPVETVVVGLAFWLMPILLVASWAAAGRIRLPHPWLAVPLGLLLVGCAVSTVVASNQSSALVRAAQVSGLWAAAFALAQAIRTDGERRLLMATLVATAVAGAAVAIYREAARSGPDAVGRAGLGQPGVLAALLVMAILVAAGFVREKWTEAAGRAKLFAVGVAAGAVAMVWALALTRSTGGIAALGIGGYLLGVGWCVKRRRLRLVLWLAPLLVVPILLGVEVWENGRPLVSVLAPLRDRLDIWRATWPILARHGLAGVGLENFGHHYLEHKLPSSPAEIASPQNMWLSVWSQLGLAGLAGAVGLFAFAVRRWLGHREPRAGARGDARAGEPLALWLAALAVLAGPGLAYLWAHRHAPLQPVLAALVCGSMVLALGAAAAEDPKRLALSGRPLRSLQGAAVAAVVAFLVHGLVNAAFLVPATTWALMVVLVAGLGPGRAQRIRSAGLPVRFALILLGMGAVFAYARLILIPVGRTRAYMRAATAADLTREARDELLRRAGRVNPLAWEPALERGRLWHAHATEVRAGGGSAPRLAMAFEPAIEAYREALARHPRCRPALVALARCRMALPGAETDSSNLEAARGYLERVVALHPTHLPTALELADVLDRLERDSEALAAYERVLELDRLMPMAGRRLSAKQREAVRERVAELSAVR